MFHMSHIVEQALNVFGLFQGHFNSLAFGDAI